MDMKVNRVSNTNDIVIYSNDVSSETFGISSLYNKLIMISPFIQLRKIAVFNNKNNKIYELKQTNIILKILYSTIFAILNDPVMCPAYKLYVNNVYYGKLYKPMYVKDQVEYKLNYKDKLYSISFHNPNVIAVLINDMQILKIEILNTKKRRSI